MSSKQIHVGTSGWLYKHWQGNFYPEGMKKPADQFKHYLEFFNTVELNNPFYRLPPKETFQNWRKATPKDFIYAVKGSRFITHMKKLKDFKEPLKIFLDHASGLKEKLGPILFQLPPGWKLNIERFTAFIKGLPRTYRFAFEFRNPTWYDKQVYDLLEEHNRAFCIYQLAGHQSPVIETADFVYLRLHGPTEFKYQGSYDDDTLRAWAKECRKWQKQNKDVYVYFDNDQAGYAAFNATRLKEILKL
jgi:uncharacterized protein YecE (DUF72 family)